jgi:hypothetical protein
MIASSPSGEKFPGEAALVDVGDAAASEALLMAAVTMLEADATSAEAGDEVIALQIEVKRLVPSAGQITSALPLVTASTPSTPRREPNSLSASSKPQELRTMQGPR